MGTGAAQEPQRHVSKASGAHGGIEDPSAPPKPGTSPPYPAQDLCAPQLTVRKDRQQTDPASAHEGIAEGKESGKNSRSQHACSETQLPEGSSLPWPPLLRPTASRDLGAQVWQHRFSNSARARWLGNTSPQIKERKKKQTLKTRLYFHFQYLLHSHVVTRSDLSKRWLERRARGTGRALLPSSGLLHKVGFSVPFPKTRLPIWFIQRAISEKSA